MLEKLVEIYHNLFNSKYAVISAVCNGSIAYYVNNEHGIEAAISAAFTQAAASFFSTGFTARLVQHFSPIENKIKSYLLGSFIPAAGTFLLSYIGHQVNDSPEILNSCIAPTAISFTTSFVTNYITRAGYLLPNNYKK